MSRRPHHLPLILALFALTCLGGLFLFSGNSLWLLTALGGLILGSYVLNLRLPTTWLPSLLFGGILLGLAILSTPQEIPHAPSTIIPPRPIFLFGQAAAILMTLQFYRPVPSDPNRPRLFVLLGGVMVLVAACNTFEEGALRPLIPTLSALLALSLRTLRGRAVPQRLTLALVGIALLSTLGTGWLGMKAIRDNREVLTEWGNKFMNERPITEQLGISQQPTLGSAFGARGSNARVLRVQGELSSFHLRGAAFDTYSDNQWWIPLNSRIYDTVEPNQLSLTLPRGVPSRTLSVTRLQGNNPLVLFPLETFSLEVAGGEQVEWSQDASGPIRIRAAQPYTYLYQEGPEGSQGLMARPRLTSSEDKAHFLQLPQNLREQLEPLAKKITAKAKTPTERVAAITGYLLENYPYSLTFDMSVSVPGIPQPDQVVRFLLAEPKQGAHCEYFASATALLLRCVGVPTRYVTGYFAHEQESATTLIVRQRDAHAWCEAWVEGKGWLTVEATPPTGWPEQDRAPMEYWRHTWEWLEDQWHRILSWLADRDPGQLALLLLLPFVGIGIGTFVQRRRRVMPITALLDLTPPPHLAALAKRFEAVVKPERTRPWSEQLTALPEAAQPAAHRFVALYQQARFGGQSVTRETLEQALKALEEAVKAKG